VRKVFQGRLISVEVQSWAVGDREVVHHPGACGVVPLTENGDVLLVRQMRESIRQVLLEIPAGIYDVDGEDPLGCAAREVLEETGYQVTDLQVLGTIHSSPGFTDERMDLFMARAEDAGGPGEEGVEVVRMPFIDAIRAVVDGRISDAHTVAAILLASHRMQET
jgi:ADP-ribose pyrophosphatase